MHWYDAKDGQPRYTVPRKKGGGMRAATIKDAREFGYVPSVTTILKQIASAGLTRWKEDKLLRAAHRFGGEIYRFDDYEGWAICVRNFADQERNKAADFGKAFHGNVEVYFKKEAIHPDMLPWVDSIFNWTQENLAQDLKYLKSEFYIKPFGGYGGRCDLRDLDKQQKLCVVDFKTQKRKKEKFRFYPSWSAQGSAYMLSILTELNDFLAIPQQTRKTFNVEDCRIISVVIDSEDPNVIDSKDWDYKEGLELFKGAFKWFKVENNWS